AVTGDVVKGYYVIKAQQKEGRTRALMTLLIDRFVGLFGLIVMAFFALIFNLELILSQENLHSLAWIICALFGITVLFYFFAIFPFKEGHDPFLRLFQRLPASKFSIKVYLAFKRFQHQKTTLFLTLVLAIGIHSLIALIFFQVAHLIGVKEIDLATQFFLMPIGLITVAIPIAPGGIGIGHVAFESLYQLAGLSGGADIFNLFIIVQLGVYLLGGIPYFLYSSEYKIPEHPEEILKGKVDQ
nr:flippase-like domain-containing protein [SAR324 cluster bacterium]